MLALVADVVALEPEEEGEPVEEVHVRVPLPERRPPQVADGAECCGGGADLGEPEGGVVGEEVVDGDDVVRLFLPDRSGDRRRRLRVTLAETHSIGMGTLETVSFGVAVAFAVEEVQNSAEWLLRRYRERNRMERESGEGG